MKSGKSLEFTLRVFHLETRRLLTPSYFFTNVNTLLHQTFAFKTQPALGDSDPTHNIHTFFKICWGTDFFR